MSDSRDRDRRRQRYAEDPEYREHVLAACRVWRKAKRDEINAKHRLRWVAEPKYRENRLKGNWKSKLKHVYGISLQEYDRLHAKQKGRCAICKDKPRYRLHLDHDHRRKFARRLLCGLCNRGLGCFRDDPRLLRRAAAYLIAELKSHRAKRKRGVPKKSQAGTKRKR